MTTLEARFKNLLNKLSAKNATFKAGLTNIDCLRISQTGSKQKKYWRACLAFVSQGNKEVYTEEDKFDIKPSTFTVTPIALPVVSRISLASENEPFLCLLIDFDLNIFIEMAAKMSMDIDTKQNVQALFQGSINNRLLDSCVKLLEIINEGELDILGTLVIKEICYLVLKSDCGSQLASFCFSGTKLHRIYQAVHEINTDLKTELTVTELAKNSGMSRSDFFKYFKKATSMSPVQYRQKLRLLEAKRLIQDNKLRVERAAYEVGYKSASQFSREFSRMFGVSPKSYLKSGL